MRNGVYHLPTGRGIILEEGSDVSSTDSEAELAAADHNLDESERHGMAELRNMKQAIIASRGLNPIDDCERRALAELRNRWETITWGAGHSHRCDR